MYSNLRLFTLALLLGFLTTVGSAGTISSRLHQKMISSDVDLPVLIFFHTHANNLKPDLTQFAARPSASTIIQMLREDARTQQETSLNLLRRFHPGLRVTQLWINNSIAAKLPPATIEQLNALPEVDRIDEDASDALLAGSGPVAPRAFAAPDSSGDTIDIAWNLSKVNADSVWLQYGLDGTGILIGHMDTGVNISHPAVAPHWRGGANSWFDAVSNKPTPYDDAGHGTGTIGIILGGDGVGPGLNDIGLAPGARFISTKMIAYSGSTPNSVVLAAAQWILDPDGNPSTNDFPRIVSNSWYSGTRGSTWFYNAAAAWSAAGIIPVFCAGNEGPNTGTTTSPGDYAICFSVGATNSSDVIYTPSSRGPSPGGDPFRPDRRKPDIVAPGAAVRSSTNLGTYNIMSGTSFSAPHVSGLIALLLQADSTLVFNDIFKIFQLSSVDLGTAGYDFTFGYGRMDALRAVRFALGRRVAVAPDTTLPIAHSGDSVTFSFVMKSPPAGNVFIQLTTHDSLAVRIMPDSLQFSHDNWNIPQQVSVRSRVRAFGDKLIRISASISSSDRMLNNVLIPDCTVLLRQEVTTDVPTPPERPQTFHVGQNYPNPFNPSTMIPFSLPEQGRVSISVRNLLGQEVARPVVDQPMTAGVHEVSFDAAQLPSGVYMYTVRAQVSAGILVGTGKMAVVK